MRPVLPFFQQLTGRNPRNSSERFPLVVSAHLFPKKNPIIIEALHLHTDGAAELFCNLVSAYPKAAAYALRQGSATYSGMSEIETLRLKSPSPTDTAVEVIRLPDEVWGKGLFQLNDEWFLKILPNTAEWVIGNQRVITDTWVSGSTRYVYTPSGVPYRLRITGDNAVPLSPTPQLVLRAVNPNKDYVTLLQLIHNHPRLWDLPFTTEIRQVIALSGTNPLAAPAILADLAAEAAFI